jgi:hypothetical protein
MGNSVSLFRKAINSFSEKYRKGNPFPVFCANHSMGKCFA